MSSPIFLIAIFLEQSDMTRVSSQCDSLMTATCILLMEFSYQIQQVDADFPKASAICYTGYTSHCAKALLSWSISLFENGSEFFGLSSVLSSWDEVCWPRHWSTDGFLMRQLMAFLHIKLQFSRTPGKRPKILQLCWSDSCESLASSIEPARRKMYKRGRLRSEGLYVACYGFMFGVYVCSLSLSFFLSVVWGCQGSKVFRSSRGLDEVRFGS